MTQKLFYDDVDLTEFDAEVVSCGEREGNFRVVLDRTAFYPTGGGQPCDLGTIAGVEVLDVAEEAGEAVHTLAAPLPAGASGVHGVVDRDRRFELMQQHLGQHLLSAMLFFRHGLATVSMHMERERVTIDLGGRADEAALRAAEAEANEAVWRDIPVEILHPDLEEIRRHTRKDIPDTKDPIRIVKVGDVDYIPCCGLHPRTTGAVGIVRVLSSENLTAKKGGTRVHLTCGRPAYRWLNGVHRDVRAIQQALTCGEADMVERVLAQKDQLRELKARNGELMDRAAGAAAAELLKEADRVGDLSVVARVVEAGGREDLQRLFRALTQTPGVVALLGARVEAGAFLILGCHREEKRVDVRDAFQCAIAMLGGRGGGSPFSAQGFCPDASRLEEALTAARGTLTAALG